MSVVADRSIGLRALRRELSSVIKSVRAGGEVLVTDRGKPVVRIAPVDEGHDVLARLEREGKLRRPKHPKQRLTRDDLIPVQGSVSDLIVEERERVRKPAPGRSGK